MKKLFRIALVAVIVTGSQAMAAFDATTEVTTASDNLGTIFGVIFTAIIAITLGWKAIGYLRGR